MSFSSPPSLARAMHVTTGEGEELVEQGRLYTAHYTSEDMARRDSRAPILVLTHRKRRMKEASRNSENHRTRSRWKRLSSSGRTFWEAGDTAKCELASAKEEARYVGGRRLSRAMWDATILTLNCCMHLRTTG